MLELGVIPTSNLQRPAAHIGAVAQLGEHLLCKEGVRSSSLLGSTNTRLRVSATRQYTAGRTDIEGTSSEEYETPNEEPEPRN